jgi:3-dehydroquinate dehydratase-1
MTSRDAAQPVGIEFATRPLVVGTLSTRRGFQSLLAAHGRPPCDVVEVRLDLIRMDPSVWQAGCRSLRERGIPVLLTIRHADEGGGWSGPDADRMAYYRAACPWVSALDVEIRQQALHALEEATERGGVLRIGSFHDFRSLPPPEALDGIVRTGVEQGADVVKVAVWLEDEAAMDQAAGLLQRFSHVRIALVGMGPLGPASRIALARAGSCLTYGYLDRSAAPGQVSAAELWLQFKPEPGQAEH